jgi:hypothetical protein
VGLLPSLLLSIVEFLKDNLQLNQAACDPLGTGKLEAIAITINKLSQVQLNTGKNGLAAIGIESRFHPYGVAWDELVFAQRGFSGTAASCGRRRAR